VKLYFKAPVRPAAGTTGRWIIGTALILLATLPDKRKGKLLAR